MILQKATSIAKRMVKDYGMSDTLGRVALEMAPQQAFLKSNQLSRDGDYSEQTAREIDQEVKQLIQTQEARVKDILMQLKAALLEGSKHLLNKEVMTGPELQEILMGQKTDQTISTS